MFLIDASIYHLKIAFFISIAVKIAVKFKCMESLRGMGLAVFKKGVKRRKMEKKKRFMVLVGKNKVP